ncbi:hypothetical protein ACJRO7_015953 [Eucalyptus globulus]|uniref:Uncharacterized protein n=1 Tax=Eucalyptus globulus TaxID=34317 RepID=A0ABD3LB10_EUCGL
MRTHSNLLSSTIVRVAAKAISMKAKERKRKQRPQMIFLGNESRKSCTSYREVKIARNSKMAITEETKPNASEIVKTRRESCPNNKGTPVLLSLPPVRVNAAVNNTVAIGVETSIHEFVVSFTHFSPFSRNSLWFSLNSFQCVI